MRKRMISSKFWSDTWVVDELNALDRYLFLYLITNERSNLIGIYELPMRVAAFETGIEPKDLNNMLARLSPKVEYIDGYIYIERSAEHQADSPAINKAMERELAALPAAIREQVRAYGIKSLRLANTFDALDELQATVAQAPPTQAPPQSSPQLSDENLQLSTPSIDHPDTITTPSSETGTPSPVSRVKVSNSKVKVSNVSSPAPKALDPSIQLRRDIQEIFDFYVKSFGAENSHIKLSDKRKTHIRMRLKDAGKEMLFKAITNTANSAFHRGDNDRGWKANIDFIIRSYEQVEKLANMNEMESAGSSNQTSGVSEDDLKRLRDKL